MSSSDVPQPRGLGQAVASQITASEDHVEMANRFLARHGAEALQEVLERLDEFLEDHKVSALDDLLNLGPMFGSLLGKSRKQLKNAVEGIQDSEHVWMILTHDPSVDKRRESINIRAMVGPCGPIKVSFEDTMGGR